MRFRVGLGYDVHPFGGEGPLVLGGVHLGGTGLQGHSDGDAVAHAVADALLGPAGLPDLGSLFPASEERWRDADSLALLQEVATRVADARWSVANVDVVVAAEAPPLAPHLDTMSANLAEAMRPAAEPMGDGIHVSITPKRGEGIGAVGRSEGIAVWAVAMLLRN